MSLASRPELRNRSTSELDAVLMSAFMIVTPGLTPRRRRRLRDGGEVDIGVVDAVEDVGEDGGGKGETDVHQLRFAVAGGLDRLEVGLVDGAAGARQPAHEANQRIALVIAGGRAVADVLQLVRLQPGHLAEQAMRGHAIVTAGDAAYDKLDGFLIALRQRA